MPFTPWIGPDAAWLLLRAWLAQIGQDLENLTPGTYDTWRERYLMTTLLRMAYEVNRDIVGSPGTEPRDTWDRGGTIAEGYAAMWPGG